MVFWKTLVKYFVQSSFVILRNLLLEYFFENLIVLKSITFTATTVNFHEKSKLILYLRNVISSRELPERKEKLRKMSRREKLQKNNARRKQTSRFSIQILQYQETCLLNVLQFSGVPHFSHTSYAFQNYRQVEIRNFLWQSRNRLGACQFQKIMVFVNFVDFLSGENELSS